MNTKLPPHKCRLRRSVAAWLLAASALPGAAQDRSPKSDAPTGGGTTVQIDLGALLRSLTNAVQDTAAAPQWPTTAAALALYSFPDDLARRPVPDGDHSCEPGELLIWWPDSTAALEGAILLRDRMALTPLLRAELATLGGTLAMVRLASNDAALALRAQLRASHPSWVVDLNARSSASAGPRLYALEQLQIRGAADAAAPAAKPVSAQVVGSGAVIRVGVIDGPTTAKEDLQVSGFRSLNVLRTDDLPASSNHGNAIARLIAAKPLSNGFAGAAPGVALHWATVTRLVKGRERSNTLAQVLALDWMLGDGVHLINISMGGPGDAVLATAFRKATAGPVILLAAAGNDGPKSTPVYPAAYPGVLAVTAVDAALQVYAWANQGPQVGLAAPGVDLWVPIGDAPSNDTPTGPPTAGQYVSGTSFATAMATGVLARWGEARLRQAHAERLAPICKVARELGAPGRDPVFGCGLVR